MAEEVATIHGKKLSKRPDKPEKETESLGTKIWHIFCILFLIGGIWASCSESNPKTCDSAIQMYVKKVLPLCESYRREKQKYRDWGSYRGYNTNQLADLEQRMNEMQHNANLIIREDFGVTCMEKFNKELIDNGCW